MFEICKKQDCTACYACINSCPQACISMAEDKYSALYPVIDNERCIHCDICRSVCPSCTPPDFRQPKKTYAAYALTEEIHNTSASGGVTALLAAHTICCGGVVYGSAMGGDLKTAFIRCNKAEQLPSLQGSKYVHSHVNFQLNSVKEDLENGKAVLFIGTPCQVAGLLGFLRGKTYGNLVTVDIVCHGVPTEKTFLSYSQAVLKKHFASADNATFRNGNDYALSYYENGKAILSRQWRHDEYLTAFLEGNIFRENCYSCSYATSQRVSDITLGDFWGLHAEEIDRSQVAKGINAVLINTEKGQALFDGVSEALYFIPRDTEEAVMGNAQLRHPAKKTVAAEAFQRLCKNVTPAKALLRYSKRHTLLCKLRRLANGNPVTRVLAARIPFLK